MLRGFGSTQRAAYSSGFSNATKGTKRTMIHHLEAMRSQRHCGRAGARKSTNQPVHGASAKEHVRPVTEVGIAPRRGGGAPPKPVSGFEHDHLVTGGRGLKGGGKSGKASAHHHDPLHAPRA